MRTSTKSAAKKAVILVAVVFTAWHIFASFLWIAPASGLREAIPGAVLRDYMIPMFGQSWSVFAPEPINGDYRLQVRATVGGGDDALTTEWVDATAAELSMLTHNLTPPRAAIQSTDIASRLKGSFDKLTDDQKEIAGLGYYSGGDWQERMAGDLRASQDNEVRTTTYLNIERVATAYSTQVALAMWGEDVEQVQFVVSRQNVIPFAKRNDPDAVRPKVQAVPTGWRGPVIEPGQNNENFARVFLKAVEKSGQ